MSADHALVETPHACELHVSQIKLADRHRQDMGDIRALADSIESRGLIQPVVVTPDHRLIAGARRIAAMTLLGCDMIPVTVIHTLADATDELLAERDENTCRKEFTASELVAIGRRLEELERPKAQERQLGGLRQGDNAPSGSTEPNGSTDQIVGEALGVSQSTYKRAKTVVNATTDPDESVREVAAAELAKLDAGETSHFLAGQRVREARAAARSAEPAAEPVVNPSCATKPKGGHRPNHLKILTNITNTLDGFVMVLEEIEEINNTVNAEDASRFRAGISNQIRALHRIRNLLKEV